MDFDLDARTASLSVGEFADFAIGPRTASGGAQGIWRAQLGTHWHQELRRQAEVDHAAARFEVVVSGQVFHAGWTLTLSGRIDQVVPLADGTVLLREIKTITAPLPSPDDTLRAAYPDYFAQLATYVALQRWAAPVARLRAELVFVEVASGLAQPVPVPGEDEALFRSRLERVTEFLTLRRRARDARRSLAFRPAFPAPRPGQESTGAELAAALAGARVVALEAPTGFGKTGTLLETGLAALKSGRFQRLLYLTSKATGQLQVVRTLDAMTAGTDGGPPGVSTWHVRNKAEHCINAVFRCTTGACAHLRDLERRWPASGLARFYLRPGEPRDLAALRAAGTEARLCPYEITRAALAFNDVWVGDYNYVFAPRNRSLFLDQPGFAPGETLLVIDEAHNLPARVADALSHSLSLPALREVLVELDHQAAAPALLRAWESLVLLVAALPACDALNAAAEDDLSDALATVVTRLQDRPPDFDALAPASAELLWNVGEVAAWLNDRTSAKLVWCPREGDVAFTCLDAAPAIGETLRQYGGVILASATLGPTEDLRAALGLDAGADLAGAEAIARVTAHTPWRTGAYDVACDVRVDTSFQQRARHQATTAATVEALCAASHRQHPTGTAAAVVVFFPSYRYAEAIAAELERQRSVLRIAVQPRLPDLAAQTAWVEESLVFADALFLILGSSFAEGIDLLGGRVSHAMVVGPALPEVNAVQRARLETLLPAGREPAFRRVYRLPGIQKVNQALGRLVRAPGHRAKVLLHCRRFVDPAFASLLATDYQFGIPVATDADLLAWLTAAPGGTARGDTIDPESPEPPKGS